MQLTWRGLETLLDKNFTPGFGQLLATDYPSLTEPLLISAQYDSGVQSLLEDANKRKNEIEVEQILARMQNKPCFLDENVNLVHSSTRALEDPPLAKKYQLLARYYFYRGDAKKFAEVVVSSIVREWATKLESLYGEKDVYVDRQPFVLRLRDNPIRRDYPSYRLRVLALRSDDLTKDFVFKGQAKTWLIDKASGIWKNSEDGYVIEPERQGDENDASEDENDDGEQGSSKKATAKKSKNKKNGDETGKSSKCSKQVSGDPESSGESKKGTGVVDNQEERRIPPFVTSFNLEQENEYFLPSDRTLDSFKKAEKSMSNIIFCINNVMIAPIPRKGRWESTEYAFRTEISFSIKFHTRTIHVNLVDKEMTDTEDCFHFYDHLLSMNFEATKNSSKRLQENSSFSFIWRTLRSYYEKKGEYTPIEDPTRKRTNKKLATNSSSCTVKPPVLYPDGVATRMNDSERSFLYWKHILPFIGHFFDRKLDVRVRTLTITEVRTILCMILSRMWLPWISVKASGQDLDHYSNKQLRMEISTAVLNRVCDNEIVAGDLRTSFMSKLYEELYAKVAHQMPDDSTFKIYEKDFTENCVRLPSLDELDFSLYQWLHAIGEILAGSQLHSEKSKTSPLMFDRCILFLRNHSSAQRTVKSIHKKLKKDKKSTSSQAATKDPDNTMLIRFNEFRKNGLVFHYADHRQPQAYFGCVDVNEIASKNEKYMKIKGSDPVDIEKAAKYGVVNKTKTEASGLYVFLRRAYPSQFTRIVERIGEKSTDSDQNSTESVASTSGPTEKPKRTATIVHIVWTKGNNCNPMYDFTLKEEPFQDGEVDAEQGPANRLLPSNSISVTAITEDMSSLGIRARARRPQPTQEIVAEQMLGQQPGPEHPPDVRPMQHKDTYPTFPATPDPATLQHGSAMYYSQPVQDEQLP